MTCTTWTLDEGAVTLDVPGAPVGPVHVGNWRQHGKVPPGGSAVVLPTTDTTLLYEGVLARLVVGCYAIVPGGAEILGGVGLVIYTPAYRPPAQIGGPLEAHRGGECRDTRLVYPPTRGGPCLHWLHLAPQIHQTPHMHPSDRIGIVLRGRGICQSGDAFVLRPGMGWYLPTGCVHSFHTNGEPLEVFAWHPGLE